MLLYVKIQSSTDSTKPRKKTTQTFANNAKIASKNFVAANKVLVKQDRRKRHA